MLGARTVERRVAPEQIKQSAVKEAEEFKKLAASEAERSAGEIKAKYEKNLKNAVDAAVKVIFS